MQHGPGLGGAQPRPDSAVLRAGGSAILLAKFKLPGTQRVYGCCLIAAVQVNLGRKVLDQACFPYFFVVLFVYGSERGTVSVEKSLYIVLAPPRAPSKTAV